MSFLSVFRTASRAVRPASVVRAPFVRSRVQTPVTLAAARTANFGTTRMLRSGHEDETYEEFSARYDSSFEPLRSLEVGTTKWRMMNGALRPQSFARISAAESISQLFANPKMLI